MSSELRRRRRRRVAEAIEVIDAMTDVVVGRIGNLSETGMLLIASAPLREDALYQLRFRLRDPDGSVRDYEFGAHLLWIDQAGGSGLAWVGLRFIAVPDDQARHLSEWIAADAQPD
jgi:hypothetical protein